jgi:antitoxin component of RelBE/YafQ-DinJ toxin-antitoxin module
VPPKDEWLSKVRVTAEEKEVFLQQAAAEGLTLSSWIRMHLLRIARENQAQAPHKVLRPVAVKKKRAK